MKPCLHMYMNSLTYLFSQPLLSFTKQQPQYNSQQQDDNSDADGQSDCQAKRNCMKYKEVLRIYTITEAENGKNLIQVSELMLS